MLLYFSDMSNRAMFERGRYFIETGTARGFSVFHSNNQGLLKYVPQFVIRRIVDLISSGDRDSAVTLWFHACENASRAPMTILKKALHIGVHILEVAAIVVFGYAALCLLSS